MSHRHLHPQPHPCLGSPLHFQEPSVSYSRSAHFLLAPRSSSLACFWWIPVSTGIWSWETLVSLSLHLEGVNGLLEVTHKTYCPSPFSAGPQAAFLELGLWPQGLPT